MDPAPPLVTGAEQLDPVDRRRLDEAVSDWQQALGPQDADAALRVGEDLQELLVELGLHEAASRLAERLHPLAEARRRAELRRRLAPDLASDDPDVRARALWTLGAELHRVHHDRAGAVGAYRQAVALGTTGWAAVAAAMNLAQLLEETGDPGGAREAYEVVVRLGPGLEEPLRTAHLVCVDRLRTLGPRGAPDDGHP